MPRSRGRSSRWRPELAMRSSQALLLALVACGKHAADEDEDHPVAAAVTCKPVVAATIDDTIEVTGVIAPPPKLDSVVSSPVAGRVGLVAVEEGDRVERSEERRVGKR